MGQVQEEQSKGILRRPVDLALVIYLTLAGFFTLFRGLVSLQWSAYLSSALSSLSCPHQPCSFNQCEKATAHLSGHPGKFFIQSDLSVHDKAPFPVTLPAKVREPRLGEAGARSRGPTWEGGEGFSWEECLRWVVGLSFCSRWCLTAPQMPALSTSISMSHTYGTLWPIRRCR